MANKFLFKPWQQTGYDTNGDSRNYLKLLENIRTKVTFAHFICTFCHDVNYPLGKLDKWKKKYAVILEVI